MADHIRKFRQVASAAFALIRADAPLYLFILVYAIAGIGFLDWAGASERLSYAIYVGRWLMLFGFMFPAVTLLIDTAFVIGRFDRRRSLAARYVFSVPRLARLLAGIVTLQAMVLFQGTFTSIKNGLSVWHGGFPYDRVQADIDKALHFGVDPWRWLYAFGEHDWLRTALEWNYNVLWFVLCFAALFYVATARRAEGIRLRYLFAFMLVWIVIGNVLAALFLSAGPAFYGMVTGDHARFAEQLQFLARGASSPSSAAAYQQYLWALHAAGQTGFASGISAFPSVHVGLTTLNALFLAEFSRRLGAVAFAYVALMVASSVYLGWHYAIDGYVAVATVFAIHYALRRLFAWGGHAAMKTAVPAATAPGHAAIAS